MCVFRERRALKGSEAEKANQHQTMEDSPFPSSAHPSIVNSKTEPRRLYLAFKSYQYPLKYSYVLVSNYSNSVLYVLRLPDNESSGREEEHRTHFGTNRRRGRSEAIELDVSGPARFLVDHGPAAPITLHAGPRAVAVGSRSVAVIACSRGVRCVMPVVMMVLPHGDDFLVVVVLASRRGGTETHLVWCRVVWPTGWFGRVVSSS